MNPIRPFRNADVPGLVDVWISHWSRLGPPPAVSIPMFEQAILGRTFFEPATLLVADSPEGIVGWSHFAVDPQHPETAVIGALCWSPQGQPLGEQLLTETLGRIAARDIARVQVGVIRDQRFGYCGLEPIGHGIGVPDDDAQLTALLGEHSFSAGASAVRMAVSTLQYRPPVSREALQLRRSTTSDRETRAADDMRQASAMSHLDVERHRLLDRSGNVIAEVDLWRSDPEAEVMNSHQAILDLGPSKEEGHLQPAESFLIASVVQSLAQEGIHRVETVIDGDQSELGDQLGLLRFQREQQGHLWQRS